MNLHLLAYLSLAAVLSLEAIAQKKDCPKLSLPNGRVRIRGAGKMAYFRCKRKFDLVGHKLAVCLSTGTWSQQIPVCVGLGCPDLGTLPDMTVTELLKGAILQFSCQKGLKREGPQKLMCDGTNWDQEPPKCLSGISQGCDFEEAGFCGWTQDSNDDFDWTWQSGGTPTSDTGPDGDHTTGSGKYIFMESSAPQKTGQVTRLLSPQYNPTSDNVCISFWYHMKGPDKPKEIGSLEVFVRTDVQSPDDDELTTYNDVNIFRREGYQGDEWMNGVATITPQTSAFRIVFAATRGEGWTGDIALDDVRVQNCTEELGTTTPEPTPTDSPTPDISTSTLDDFSTDRKTTTKKTRKPTPPTMLTTTTKAISTTRRPSLTNRTMTTPITATTTATTTTTTTTATPPLTTMPTTQPTTTVTSTTKPTTMTPAPPATTFTSSATTLFPSESTEGGGAASENLTPSPLPTSSVPFTYIPPSRTEAASSSSQAEASPSVSSSAAAASTSSSSSSSSSAASSASPAAKPDQDKNGSVPSPTTTDSLADSPSSPSSSSFSTTDDESSGEPDEYLNPGGSTSQTTTRAPGSRDQEGAKNEMSTGSGGSGSRSSLQAYLPLIVGVSLGLGVGAAVVGVLAWLWARNKRKQKELAVEEDQLNIIGSIEASSYSYPPSGSEH